MADLIDTSTTIPGSAGRPCGQVPGGRLAELPEEQRRAGADGEGSAAQAMGIFFGGQGRDKE